MAWDDELMMQGYVPKGATPKVYNPETGGYENQARSPLVRLLRTMEVAQINQQAKQEKVQKDNDKKLDIYKTLREQGYDPKKAYDAATKGVLPMEAPGETMKEQTEAAGLAKTKAETDKIRKGINTKTKEDIENEILDKVSKGMALSPGDQKIYDDVIKRRKDGDGESVGEIITSKTESAGGSGDMVAVFDPDGNPGFVPKAKLAAALAKGFTRR